MNDKIVKECTCGNIVMVKLADKDYKNASGGIYYCTQCGSVYFVPKN